MGASVGEGETWCGVGVMEVAAHAGAWAVPQLPGPIPNSMIMRIHTTFHVLLASLASPLCAAATPQISPDAQAIYIDAFPFAVLDHDGDGDDELIAPSPTGEGIAAYTISLDGRLVVETTLSEMGRDLRDLVLTDFDGDGLEDLLGIRVAMSGQRDLVAFFDRGGSTYDDPVTLYTGLPGLFGLAATDFDLDGDDDVLLYPASTSVEVVGSGGDSAVVLFNEGGGFLTGPTQVQSFNEPLRSATAMDLDQDGDFDLAALRAGSGTLVLLRKQGGVLQVEAIPSSPMNYQALAVGDVNGDGREDVVALRQLTTGGAADVDLYLANSAGGLGSRSTILAGALGLAADVSLLDIDGDGDLDLSIAELGAPQAVNRMRTLEGDGLGGFGPSAFSGQAPGQAWQRSRVGDFNGDGLADLFSVALAQESQPREVAVIRRGTTAASFESSIEVGRFDLDLTAMSGDFDGDGVQDLLSGSAGDLLWFRGLVDGSGFDTPVVIGGADELVLAANFDGDAADEIVVVSQGGFQLIDSYGGGAFAQAAPLDLGFVQSTERVRASDIDSDGDLDLTFTVPVATEFKQSFNLGGLVFAPPVSLPLQGSLSPTYLQPADFNGDGLVDLHGLVFGFPSVFSFGQVWYEGLGGGQFGPQQLIGESNTEAMIVDLNEDGFDDVVWHGTSQPAGIYLATGGPIGTLPTDGDLIVAATSDERPLGAVDFDGDGRKDFLTYNLLGQVFGYPRLSGSALAYSPNAVVLTQPLISQPGGAAGQVQLELVDIGGDGDLDVVISLPEGDIFWHSNDARGPVGTEFCGPGNMNSTGFPGRMLVAGTPIAAANEMSLHATDLPQFSFGFFITSQTQVPAAPVIASEGLICLGGSVGRYVGPGQVKSTGVTGSFGLDIDVTAIPTPVGFVSAAPGATWSYQAWHRDTSPTGPTSNFTNGLEVTFQ